MRNFTLCMLGRSQSFEGSELLSQKITSRFTQGMMWNIGLLHYSRKSRLLQLAANFSKAVKENWVIQ